jgi:hypothetical protein
MNMDGKHAKNSYQQREIHLIILNDKTLHGPTISFRCIQRFFQVDQVDQVDQADQADQELARLELIDAGLEDTRKATKATQAEYAQLCERYSSIAAKQQLTKASKLRGYVLTHLGRELCWHRTSEVLLYDPKHGMSYYFGVDDNQYFGCEIAGRCKSLQNAYLLLAPKEALTAKGTKFLDQVKRQGEWFAIPVAREKVEQARKKGLLCTATRLLMPLDDEFSGSEHELTGTLLVTKDGEIYATDARMSHEQHMSMDLTDGWWYFRHNRAVRSFSENGVD